MIGTEQTSSRQSAAPTTVIVKLPELKTDNLARMAAFLVQGNDVLMQSSVTANGARFRLAGSVVIDPCLIVILGPKGVSDQMLLARSDLPRLSLSAVAPRDDARETDRKAAITLDFTSQKVNDEIVEAWWLWCRTYTISGTVQTQDGCPAPAAEVTIYNVTSGASGLIETPIETVQTNAEGQFTASFNWCDCLCCWPCWPIWWSCWPWWWELDILATIKNIEGQLSSSAARGALRAANVAPLRRPIAADLMTGQGFTGAGVALTRDPERTALIASKFANAQIRELFPWWWWCCDSPNIVFSVTQNGNVVLDETPATATRWCFASGQSVTLVGNSQTIGVCPPPVVCEGFGWVSVGNPGILVENITNGYANGTAGTDASNMAFVGALNIYGGFNDTSVPFYQVYAGLWTGTANPARGGIAPGPSSPISIALTASALVLRGGVLTWVNNVPLGPCSFGVLDNLYMTQSQRQNPPPGVTGLGPNPFLPGDNIITWSNPGLIVSNSGLLIGSAPGGGVDLTLVAYDASGAELALTSNNPLTLMIDTTGLAQHSIDSLNAYTAAGTPVALSSSSTTDCPSYHIGPGGYVLLHVTVTDPNPSASLSLNEHLYAYEIETQFGHGSTSVPTAPPHRGYVVNPYPFTPPGTLPGQVYGIDSGYDAPNAALVSFGGGGDTIQISPTVSCCYDFQLWAGKRVTDGQSFFYTWGNVDFWTASLDVSPIV